MIGFAGNTSESFYFHQTSQDAFYRILSDTRILATIISEEGQYNHPVMAADNPVFQEHLNQLRMDKRPDGKI